MLNRFVSEKAIHRALDNAKKNGETFWLWGSQDGYMPKLTEQSMWRFAILKKKMQVAWDNHQMELFHSLLPEIESIGIKLMFIADPDGRFYRPSTETPSDH